MTRVPRAAAALVLLLLLIAAPHVRAQAVRAPGAQDVRFSHLTVEDGLSQSIVREIFQDRRGFLWIGTNNGLNQYDGYRVTIFRHEPGVENSLPANIVTSIAETVGPDGSTLWVGTYQGLTAFDVARRRFVTYRADPANPRALTNHEVQTLHVDRQGVLWVGTNDGLSRFDSETRQFVNYRHRPGDARTLTGGMVVAMAEAADGTLWVGTAGGLSRIDAARERITRFEHDPRNPASLADNHVRTLLVDRRGRLWIGTDTQGIDRYDAAGNRFLHFPPAAGVSGPSVNSLLEDADGQLWAGVWGGGLNRIIEDASGRVTFVAYRHSAADPLSIGVDDVNVLAQDRSGVLWVGTYGAGLSWFNPRGRIRLTQYRHSSSEAGTLSDDRVYAIHVDRGGSLWVGTWAGLNLLRPGGAAFERVRLGGTPAEDRVTSLAEGPDGTMWAGTLDGGVVRIDPHTLRHDRLGTYRRGGMGPTSNRVTALYADPAGDLWIGTLNDGVSRRHTATGAITHYRSSPDDPTTLSGSRISYLTGDHRGTIWVATSVGLDALDPATGRVTRATTAPGAPAALAAGVNAVHEFPAGVIWTGTSMGGVIRFHAGADGRLSDFRSFDRRHGLSSELVNRVLHDERGMIWIATSSGLDRLDPATGSFLTFDASDGLRSEEFYSGAFYDAARGRMLVGGSRGMIAFDPSGVRTNPYPPPVALTGFTILNQPVAIGGASPLQAHISATERVTLSHRDSVFALEFAAFNYAAPGLVRYAYRLAGFDPDWNYTDASRRSATYTNLDPGEYVFEVRAANRDGLWSAEPARLAIVILPPFWATWWFQALVVAAVLAAAFGAHRRRVRAIEARQRELEQLVEVRTSELRDQTAQATEARAAAERASADKSMFLANITHEIRTPLNAVVGLADALGTTKLTPLQSEYARALRSAGEALSEIVTDILDVSKIDADRFELVRAPFDLRQLVNESLDVARVASAVKGLSLEIGVASDLPAAVIGDQRALRRVLLNLLGNAVKFTAAGTVSMTVTRETGSDMVRFGVSDTGIGIPPAEQERIFETFVQAGRSASSKDGGAGLGLAICRRLVELMGGRIWVESAPGQGSTFTFTVPLPAADAPAAIDDTASEDSGLPLRVLVADDAEQNRMVMRAYFDGTQHAVTFAGSGEEAVELFVQSRFDVVLMDVHMPGMDGYAATRAMRDWERTGGRPRTRILAVTANAFAEDVQKSRLAGCDGHLTKPLRRRVLFAALRADGAFDANAAGDAASPAAGASAPVAVPTEVAPYIPQYLAVTRGQVALALAAVDAGDSEALRTLGHNLKGSGSSFGLDEISRLGRRLEQAGARGDVPQAREAVLALQSYLKHLEILPG